MTILPFRHRYTSKAAIARDLRDSCRSLLSVAYLPEDGTSEAERDRRNLAALDCANRLEHFISEHLRGTR